MQMFFGFFPLLLFFFIVPMLIGRTFRRYWDEPDPVLRIHPPVDSAFTARVERSRHEGRIFRLAKDRGGTLTLSDVIIETGLGMKEAEEIMDGLVDGSHVMLEVNDRGRLVYEFPELKELNG